MVPLVWGGAVWGSGADEIKIPREGWGGKCTDAPQVKRIYVAQRENPIVNRLNKTKVERKPDLRQEKEDRDKVLRRRQQSAQQERVSQFHPFPSPKPSLPPKKPRLACPAYSSRSES